MAKFKFNAKSAAGRTESGVINARTEEEALAELRKRQLSNITIKVDKGGFGLKPGASTEDIVIFTRQLATMIGAGIPLMEAMEILHAQSANPRFAMVLDRVVEDIRAGSDLSAAMGKYPTVFSNIYLAMIRAGEVSGQIDEILVRLAGYMEEAQKLKSEIKSAMTYPVVSICMITGITLFLMVYIVPQFGVIFGQITDKNGNPLELPGITKVTLGISDFILNKWWVMLLGIIGFAFALKTYKKTDRGAYQWDWLMLKMPVFGQLFSKVALSRFSKTFATLIKSGVPILGALEIVSATSGNRVIMEAVDGARDSVREGNTLAEPLGRSPVFPPMVVKMIAIGERSGALESLLEKISIFYDEQVEASVKALTSLIEPIMIGIMGVMVGGIVLAVFYPILKLQSALM
ncbi:MAG: type II secretion system F family protein [Planctomycetaceae bacterium]|nr:type II secretion system F family protein [Planctomycetota bacterium]NUN52371.1 type II secretion system F family protein [Planctomycetaceae bacterium]